MRINPYMAFNGNCREAFAFYQQALGGELVFMLTNGESPMAAQIPPERHDKIMHVELAVGDFNLMGGDMPEGQVAQRGNVMIGINVDDASEAERIFKALSDNAQIDMAMEETFWAKRFGMLTDQFGIAWMVNCDNGTM